MTNQTPIIDNAHVFEVNVLALRQSRMIVLVLGAVLASVLAIIGSGSNSEKLAFAIYVVAFILQIGVLLGGIDLINKLSINTTVAVPCAIMMIIPCVSVLVLLLLNGYATEKIRRASCDPDVLYSITISRLRRLAWLRAWVPMLILLTFCSLLFHFVAFSMEPVTSSANKSSFIAIRYAYRIAAFMFAVLLVRKMWANIWFDLLAGLLMLIPGINILALIAVYGLATDRLRRTGMQPGLFSVKNWDALSAFAKDRCRNCDYNLTGNVNGICPECGFAIVMQPSIQK